MSFNKDDEVTGIGQSSGRVYVGLFISIGKMLALPEKRVVYVKRMRKLTPLEKVLK